MFQLQKEGKEVKNINPIRIEDGIHTIEISQKTGGYHYIKNVVAPLFDYAHHTNDENLIHVLKSDKVKLNELFEVNYNFKDGINMRINKSDIQEFNYIKYIINPSSLSNNCFEPENLYIPVRDNRIIDNTLAGVINDFNYLGATYDKDWHFSYDRLSLSRIDLTRNIYFDIDVNLCELIRLFKKSYRKSNFLPVSFGDERDKHSFRIKSQDDSQSLSVYDKIYEIKNHHKNSDVKYDSMNILRVEISLKRSEFIRMLKETCSVDELSMMSFDEMIYKVYFLRNRVFRKYLSLVFRCSGKHYPFDVAQRIIRKEIDSSVDVERMIYFMNKVSNSVTYHIAMEKTMRHFNISQNVFFRIERLFDKINVNPICFVKNSDSKSMESFYKMMFNQKYYSRYTGEFFTSLNNKLKLISSEM